MDRRQQKTRKAILRAFEELIAQKSYKNITVQQIIDRADVGRTTFYAHFETKDSVLDELCDSLFSHVFSTASGKEETHDFSGQEKSEKTVLLHILYHLEDDKGRFGKLFRGESGNIFWNRFMVQFEKVMDGRFGEATWKVPADCPPALYHRLYITSFVEIVRWWFEEDCRETPEQIAQWFDGFCSRQ